MKNNIGRLLSVLCILAMIFSLTACGKAEPAPVEQSAPAEQPTEEKAEESVQTFKVGICNYVDDASLNQIVDNIQTRLAAAAGEKNIKIEVMYDNCNADATVMEQIISNFIAEKADLLIGVATPVAMRMQALTEDNQLPVIFSAVSSPVGAGLVESMEAPGHNVTGTSDYLDTGAIMNLIFALKPEASKIGLLYDVGQDSSTEAIKSAKAFLEEKGVEVVEHTGSNNDEIILAAQAMVRDGVDAVFTPTDNTVMTAELAIYEILSDAGIPHFTGADSFALNGAFLGYGVDYANLGAQTADMAVEVLLGADPAATGVKTFDNGTATVNTEICEKLGFKFDEVKELFAPYCTQVNSIVTAEEF